MKNIRILVLLTMFSINAQCQSNEFRNQRAQLMVFNIGFNGLIGGVGRLINNEENISGFQAFTKGFYQGAIGGAISHTGLSMTHQIQKKRNISYAWPSRLVNALGSSIVQNTAEGRRMFERMHLNLYVTRLEYFPYEKKFTGRLFTSSVYGILKTAKNAKLNLSKSLQSGVIYFESAQNFTVLGLSGRATAQVSSIGMRTDLTPDDFYNVFAHETAHILQYDRKVGGNALLFKVNRNLTQTNKLYNTLSKYIYFDMNGPLFWLGYKIEGNIHNCNFFEQEAENYSGKRAYICR